MYSKNQKNKKYIIDYKIFDFTEKELENFKKEILFILQVHFDILVQQ